MKEWGILIGRFQPLHNGHLALISAKNLFYLTRKVPDATLGFLEGFRKSEDYKEIAKFHQLDFLVVSILAFLNFRTKVLILEKCIYHRLLLSQ